MGENMESVDTKKRYLSSREILTKLIWDTRYKIEDYEIAYINRGAPNNISRIRGSLIQVHSKVFSIDRTEIPYHRIIEIRKINSEEIVFSRSPPKTSGV